MAASLWAPEGLSEMLDLGCLPHLSDLWWGFEAGVRPRVGGRRAQPGFQESVRRFTCEFCIGSWEPRLLSGLD